MRKIILGFFCFISLSVSAQDYVFRNYSVLNELFAKDSYHHVTGEVFVVGKTTQQNVMRQTGGRKTDTPISQQRVEIFLNPFRSDVLGVSLS